MGAVIRILVFVVGALGLLLTGLNGAETLNVDTDPLLAGMGETAGGAATTARDTFGGGLDAFGAMLANWTGTAGSEEPGAVQKFGPEGIAALVSALMMMFSSRRS